MLVRLPKLIEFNSIGSSDIGYISVAQQFELVPFEIKRVYWTYFTPQSVKRGGHANIGKELILIAVSGSIKVTVENQKGEFQEFVLDSPDMGLYIPEMYWHTMTYSHNAVQLVIASNDFSPEDYIRDYQQFKSYGKDS